MNSQYALRNNDPDVHKQKNPLKVEKRRGIYISCTGQTSIRYEWSCNTIRIMAHMDIMWTTCWNCWSLCLVVLFWQWKTKIDIKLGSKITERMKHYTSSKLNWNSLSRWRISHIGINIPLFSAVFCKLLSNL